MLYRWLAALWAGSLWCVGYLVAPTLFAQLDDRVLAGEIAGWMFARVSQLGLVCALILTGVLWWARRGALWRDRRWWLVLALALAALAQWQILQPMMHALKMAGDVGTEPLKARFAMLHGVSGSLYLLQSLLAAALVGSRRPVSC